MKELLSAYMDGAVEQGSAVVDGLRGDPDARDDWFLYQLVGDALRGQTTPDDGFSRRILAALDNVQIDLDYDPLQPGA